MRGALKAIAWIERLARKRAAGQTYEIWDMKDHARQRLLLNDFSQIPQVESLLRQKNIPFTSEAVGPTEWGYRGYHITFRNANGIGAEIQLSRPDVWAVKLESDKIYEKWRNIVPDGNIEALTPQQQIEYFADLEKSRNMWNQLDLPDFNIWANSSSERTLASQMSSRYRGERAGTQEPLISSKTPLPSRMGEMSSMRPDSVKQAIDSPLSNSSISQISINVNSANPRG